MSQKTTTKSAEKEIDPEALKKLSKQIDLTFESVAKLSGSAIPPTDFFQQFLKLTVDGINGVAGAIWLRTPQGFLQLQCMHHFEKLGLDDKKGARQTHNELLRRAFQMGRGLILEPFARLTPEEGLLAANMTNFMAILAPILLEDGQSLGLLEVFLEPFVDQRIQPTFMNYVIQMAGYASNYQRNGNIRKSAGEEKAWTQLESFARLIHSSLEPAEVAFQIAKEGKRLIACDRVCVAVRRNDRKSRIEAVSGADVIENSSSHIRRMRKLVDETIQWGEKVTYNGTRDETLPPRVLKALDSYLAESNPKLLVLMPLHDDREVMDKAKPHVRKKARSALLIESFETPEKLEPMMERLDIVASHAAPALYNSIEMNQIPLKVLWKPLAILQNGLGGKARFWLATGISLFVLITLAMIFIPYPLKLDAKGQLLPLERHYIYPQMEGRVITFRVNPGDHIRSETIIAEMMNPDLMMRIAESKKNIAESQAKIKSWENSLLRGGATSSPDNFKTQKEIESQLAAEKAKLQKYLQQLDEQERVYFADKDHAGTFVVKAPAFEPSRSSNADPVWTILTTDYKDQLTQKTVRASEPLMRIGNVTGAWVIEQKIPQKHVGQLMKAFKSSDPEEFLEVDVLLRSNPNESFRGRLYRKDISGAAVPNKDDNNQSEPVLHAYVTINHKDIPDQFHIPIDLLKTGSEVTTKIRCGDHAMGYSLFYGVWEFIYEHVIFYF